MNEDNIKKLVEKYPNDMELGSKVREMYWNQRDVYTRHRSDLQTTVRFTSRNSQ